ncbi:MAG: Hsp20/alpha crystallin family protein [Candidatus Rokubacteria bacterium]|nr:Hsp20/alpha crystallin family protein [Candidatus Rokubacteria bacterium]
MRALTPWTGMLGLRHEMDRMFDRFFEPRWYAFEAEGEWMPELDVSETADAVTVKVEVPGVDQKDIGVSLQNQLLTIKGEKQQEKEDKDERYHRVERTYGAFTRTVRLPAPVMGEKATATFKNGVLTVTMPKAPEAKAAPIPVKAA